MYWSIFDEWGVIPNLCWRKTVNSKLYVQVKEMLVKWILRVKPQFQEQDSCFLVHNNAPAHSAMIGQHFLAIVVWFRCHLSAQYTGWERTALQSALNQCTVQTFTESEDNRCCVNTIFPPEDGHVNARNMSGIIV